MAIKIDLLPGHVKERRILQRAILGSALALALVGTGLVLALDVKNKELATEKTNLEIVSAVAAQTDAAETIKTAADTAAQPITDTVAFMLFAGKTGPQRAALLNQVRQYIYLDTVVKTIDLSDGINANVEGSVKNPTEYAQFLFNLRRAGPPPGATEVTPLDGPLFASAPKAAGVGGFNNGAAEFVPPAAPTDQPVIIVYPLAVKATGPLKYPIPVLPDPVGASGTAGAPGAAGSGGGLGGQGAPSTSPAPGASPSAP